MKVLQFLILGEKVYHVLFILGTMYLGGSFPLGNYVGEKIIWEAIFLGGNFQGYIVRGAISFEVIFWEQSSREQLSRHCSRDMELDRICYLGHFLPFYPTTTQKIKILKKSKKHLEILNHFTHVYQKLWPDEAAVSWKLGHRHSHAFSESL